MPIFANAMTHRLQPSIATRLNRVVQDFRAALPLAAAFESTEYVAFDVSLGQTHDALQVTSEALELASTGTPPVAERPLLIGGTANSEMVTAEGVPVYGNNEHGDLRLLTRSMISGHFINHSMSDDLLITPASHYYFPQWTASSSIPRYIPRSCLRVWFRSTKYMR
jgi:hypothetical protein